MTLKVVAALALLGAAGCFLQYLAQIELTAYLRDGAAHALALDASGQTPYRWEFHDVHYQGRHDQRRSRRLFSFLQRFDCWQCNDC